MKLFKSLLVVVALLFTVPYAKADKGMFVISELKKENLERMRELGFNLTADDIYNPDRSSLSDAVVIFDRGCTGITVSDEGLIFTNHHCGYGAIQQLSSVEHDYLQDGFVSYNKGEELPVPGLTVHYMREMVDVTSEVLASVVGIEDEMERLKKERETMDFLVKRYEGLPHTSARVYPFYERNAFYLIVYDVFKDVRLVFAPPTSMGKFGADTDNWVWPRHTNDFSVFRVYAGADNRPAEYAADNKPYKPLHFAKISLGGVKDKDFAMTIGFPGSTDRYLSSWGVESRIKDQNEPRILVRGIKQDIWMEHMLQDQAIRIQYASKYAGSSNYWKNSIGMNRGLRQLNVVDNKREIECQFSEWVAEDPARMAKYGTALDDLRSAIEGEGALLYNYTILSEALNGTELRALTALPNEDITQFDADALYKDFSPVVARATLPAMLKVVKEQVSAEYLPTIFTKIEEEFNGDFEQYADHIYQHSVVVSKDRIVRAMENYDAFKAAHETDPAVELVASFHDALRSIGDQLNDFAGQRLRGRRLFFTGLQEMTPDEHLPSDANFTMRLSYGSVGGYEPYDAAWYNYYTTEAGIFQKEDSTSHEFAVQPEILEMLRAKDFGAYADEDGTLHLNFISNNDITGGNSGSPVFNANGDVIGLAFDGNWEAMSGDIEFEPNLQRCINVDIRYVLWAIDKWGKAQNIIDELTIVDR